MKPRLLDLFCCAGGAGAGYTRAQPRYPGKFVQADAIHYLLEHWQEFDAVHASPPCQAYSPLNALPSTKNADEHPDLVGVTRAALDLTGLPYVIENVMAAPLIKDRSIVLCGGMFGLRTYRHRRFESPWFLMAPQHPKHVIRTATKRRRELWDQGWHVSITGDVGTYVGPEAMGIDWMTGNELSEAIPPPFTEFVGLQMLEHVTARAAA